MWTILGPVPIDQVAPGDLVLAIHEHSGEVGFFPVSDLIVTDGAATNAVTLFHDTGDSETLDVTDEHPFWIESRGDARGPGPAGWARADTLAPGDTVRTLAGLARVESVAAEARRQRVHNLSVADARTFLVGDGGAWVHNCHLPQVSGFIPAEIIKVPRTGTLGGAAFMSPDGKVYVGIHHGHVADELEKAKVWTGTKAPKGWYSGFLDGEGRFSGGVIS